MSAGQQALRTGVGDLCCPSADLHTLTKQQDSYHLYELAKEVAGASLQEHCFGATAVCKGLVPLTIMTSFDQTSSEV